MVDTVDNLPIRPSSNLFDSLISEVQVVTLDNLIEASRCIEPIIILSASLAPLVVSLPRVISILFSIAIA